MRLLVKVVGIWTTGIEDWRGTSDQQRMRKSFEVQGYETKVEG